MLAKNTITKTKNSTWEMIENQIDARVLVDEEDRQKAFELRYQVYCLERGFLDLRDYPNRIEQDKYDENAIQIGLFDKSTNEIVATARIIKIERNGSPILEHCIFAGGEAPRLDGSAAEVSRLVVNRHYALQPKNAASSSLECDPKPVEWPVKPTRIVNPSLMLMLCQMLYTESRANGIEFLYVAMERGLHRLLNRNLMSFQQVGPAVDYYGPVIPYRAKLSEFEQQLLAQNRDMLNRFRKVIG